MSSIRLPACRTFLLLLFSVCTLICFSQSRELADAEQALKQGKYAEALEKYTALAERGNAEAMLQLGNIYYYGWGTKADHPKALVWYDRSAVKGNTKALLRKGLTYYFGNNRDYQKAKECFEQAAAKGEREAMRWLADVYEEGRIVPQDFSKAYQWYKKGKDLGDTSCTFHVGLYLQKGKGVPKNTQEALKIFKKMVKDYAGTWGEIRPLNGIGEIYYYDAHEFKFKKGKSTAEDPLPYFKKAYLKACPQAATNLGYYYFVESNYNFALHYLNWAVKAGDPLANLYLGRLYADGLGVDRNGKVAKKHFEQVLIWHYLEPVHKAKACVELAQLYSYGKGLKENPSEAVKWYIKAVEFGETKMVYSYIAELYEERLNNDAQALQWYMKDAEVNDDYDAIMKVAEFYEEGKGVKKNCKEAFKWYSRAMKQDDTEDASDGVERTKSCAGK